MLLNTHVYILHSYTSIYASISCNFSFVQNNIYALIKSFSSNANVPFNIASIDMYSIKRSLKILTRIRSNTRMMHIYNDFISKVNDKFQIVYGQSHRPSFVLLIIFFSSFKQEIFGKHGPLWIRVRHFFQVSHFSSLELIGLSWSPDVSRPSLRSHGWLLVNFHTLIMS